jgi:hypothetical protein
VPSKSSKQHNLMAAVANNPAFAKKAGIPQSVGSDFIKADKGRTFAKGGNTMATKGKMFGGKETYAEEMKEGRALKSGKMSVRDYAKGEMAENKKARGGTIQKMPMAAKMGSMNMAKGGRAMARGGGIESKGKTKGEMVKMKGGGSCGK